MLPACRPNFDEVARTTEKGEQVWCKLYQWHSHTVRRSGVVIIMATPNTNCHLLKSLFIEFPSIWVSNLKSVTHGKSNFYIIKKFILPRLGICRSGRPHHSSPLPQISSVDCILLMLLHTHTHNSIVCVQLTDHCTKAHTCSYHPTLFLTW